jgi:aspartate beta-hydroxylase
MSGKASLNTAVEQQVLHILAGIEQARAQRRAQDLGKLLQEAERIAPTHPLVLLEKAKQKLYANEPSRAIEILAAVVQQHPDILDVWLCLAHAHRVCNQLEAELTALNQALKLDASHPLILLQKADVLDLLGRPKAAVKIYGNALKTLPSGQTFSPAIQRQIELAQRRVSEGAEQLAQYLDTALTPLADKTSTHERRRFTRAIERFLGRKPIYTPDPTLFLFPYLSNHEFYDRALFGWLEQLEAATAEIRAECLNVLATPAQGLEPYVAYPEGLPLNQWAQLNQSRRWSAFFLWKEGAKIPENSARCPNTVRALSAIETRVDIPQRGPTAFFSILDANTTIPAHTGVTNTRLTVHLPLVVPPGGCAFRVGAETRDWEEGKAWVFDDSIEHEAHNPTDLPRAILIFDVWHPELTDHERQLVRETMVALNQYYQTEGVSPEWAL